VEENAKGEVELRHVRGWSTDRKLSFAAAWMNCRLFVEVLAHVHEWRELKTWEQLGNKTSQIPPKTVYCDTRKS
jgi:hypothetical protein